LALEHVVEATDFLAVAVDRIAEVARIAVGDLADADEQAELSRHGTEAGHLPEQPRIDPAAPGFGIAVEEPALAGEILEDGAGFEDGDWLALAILIDQSGNAAVGINY